MARLHSERGIIVDTSTASKPGLREIMKTMNPTMKLLLAIVFIEMMAVNFYVSVLMPYYKSLGYESDAAGIVTSVVQVVSALVLFGAGFAADKIGRRQLYLTGQVMRCLAAASLLLTRSYAGLLLVSCFRGLSAIQSPAQNAIIAGYTHKGSRATTLALSQTFGQLASFLVPVAAGTLADRVGVKVPFSLGLALAVLAVMLGLRVREAGGAEVTADRAAAHEAPKEEAENPLPPPRESYYARVKSMFTENNGRVLWTVLAAELANGLANGATNILLPYTIMDRFSPEYSAVSGMQAAGALGTMLVLLIGGRIADTYGRKGIVAVSSMVFPTALISIFFITSLWQMYAMLMVVVMLGNISSPAISAIHLEVVREKDRASFSGLSGGVNAASIALGSAIAGFVYSANADLAWASVIALFLAGGLMYWRAVYRQEKDAGVLHASP
jgi:MFS family permease